MAIKSTGPLSMTEIKNEAFLGETPPTTVNLNSVIVRGLAKITNPNTIIRFSDFYGKAKYTFENGDFSNGFTGWVVVNQTVQLNGFSTIEGYPTPADDYSDVIPNSSTYSSSLTADLPPGMAAPSQSVNMANTGSVPGSARVHGPYLVSESPVALEVGDQVSFWWKAVSSSDAYDVFAYLINTTNGNVIPLLNQTGANQNAFTTWAKITVTISAGQQSVNKNIPDYKFVFVSGSWDATGGTVTGASLYVTMIEIKKWFQ